MSVFKEARFHDEAAARAWFEAARWPEGPICPHCKGGKHYPTKIEGRYRWMTNSAVNLVATAWGAGVVLAAGGGPR